MSDSDDHKGTDPILVPPGMMAGIIALAAIVGGVAGYLICHFSESGETAEADCPPSISAVHENAQPVPTDYIS